MELYRITRQKYATDLSGNGAALYGGRWNETGKPVLYAASSRSLAILETLVHLRQPQPPTDYQIMVLFVPDTILSLRVTDQQLPDDWKQNETHTQRIGSEWLASAESLLLRTPSVVVHAEANYLLNPAHKSYSEVQLLAHESIEFDARFFHKMN